MFNVNIKFALDADNPLSSVGSNRVKANTVPADHAVQAMARPNNDTLCMVAMVDVSEEPIVMEMPAFDSTYVSLICACNSVLEHRLPNWSHCVGN